MAELPLHLVLTTFVMVISQLLIKSSHCRPTEFLFILSVRNGNVVVTENGTIFSTTSPPTLYSLIRMPYIAGKEYDGDHKLSLEAVASNSKICMDRNGTLYVKHNNSQRSKAAKEREENDTRENGDRLPRRRHRHRRGKKKKKMNKSDRDECSFKIYKFHPNESYYKDAIYSAPYSTSKHGRFLAFGRDGYPKRLKKPFKNLSSHARLGMLIEIHTPHNIEQVINETKFSRSKKINHKIRQCIHKERKRAHVFSTQIYRHDNVTQVIRTCRRLHDPRFRRLHARKLFNSNDRRRRRD